MAGEVHPVPMSHAREHDIRTTAMTVIGGSVGEIIGGAAAVVLAILGLSNILPMYMAPIAAIAVGAGLVLQGGTMGARLRQLLSEATQGPVTMAELGGGISTEFIGGSAVLVLGILALLNVQPMALLAVAALVLGGTVVISSGAASRLNALAVSQESHHLTREIAREAVKASAGAQVLVGLASIVLGILALESVEQMTLVMVAFLAVGGSVLLTGAAISGHLSMVFHHES
jgi:hypothetical protein